MSTPLSTRTRWVVLPLFCAFLALYFAGSAAGSEDRLAASAQIYAERFMSGEFSEIEAGYTPQMKTAMTPAKSKHLRDMLVAQNGTLNRVGDAWFEDEVQGYRRYRVPLQFDKATLDMRIVFDSSDRVAGMFLVDHSEPPPTTGAPGRQVDVTVGDSERGLPGTLTLPVEGDGPFPAAILIHGSGPNDRDETIGPNKPFRDLAWGLAERGIATLRYDKRSLVRPDDLLALGEDLTVREEVIDDALAGIDLLRRHPEIDPNALFIVGHSLGGTLAPRIAESASDCAGVVVLAGSTLPIPEKMVEQTRYIASLDGVITPEEQAQIDLIAEGVNKIRSGLEGEDVPPGYYLGAPLGYYRDLEAFDAPAILASLEVPCLVLQGGRDYQVTIDDFELWRRALAGRPDACLHVFENLDHLFREGEGPSGPRDYDVYAPMSSDVIDCVAGWMRTRACCPK